MVRCYMRGLLATSRRRATRHAACPGSTARSTRSAASSRPRATRSCTQVGRTWAQRHGVTIETLFQYVPRSNDPGCSAGFGMGMAMYLGPKLILDPRSIAADLRRAPDAIPRVHVRPRRGSRVHARLPRAARPRGRRLQARSARTSPPTARRARSTTTGSRSGAATERRSRDTVDTSPESVCGAIRPTRGRAGTGTSGSARPTTRVYEPAGHPRASAGSWTACSGPGASAARRSSCRASATPSTTRAPAGPRSNGHVQLPARRQRPGPRRASSFEQLRLFRTCGDLPTTHRGRGATRGSGGRLRCSPTARSESRVREARAADARPAVVPGRCSPHRRSRSARSPRRCAPRCRATVATGPRCGGRRRGRRR